MFVLVVVVIVLLVLATRCRRNHPGLKDLQGVSYAHRGLHGKGVPENSLAAFRLAVDRGYGAELDVHLLKDGGLAVIHDSLLNRTTGQPGFVEDLTVEELKNYPLEGTEETIPQLQDVLELFAGRTPLIIELKTHDGNYAALTETVCRLLEGYKGVFCIESFDPRCLIWLRKNRPDIIRGQLAMNYTRTRSDMPDWQKIMLTNDLMNFLTVPDFIAYDFRSRKDTLFNRLCLELWKAQGVAWTLRTPEEYATAKEEGWLPIFEGFEP